MPAWISVFRGIPWMQLIVAAPAIARGARRLWTEFRKPSDGQDLDAPGDRLERLELEMEGMKKELLASNQLIKAMAEQNERLLEAVGILRLRVIVLAGVCTVLLVLAIALAVHMI